MIADDNDNPFAYHIMDEVRRSSMPTYSRDLRPGKLLNEPKPIRVMGTYQLSDELRDEILDSFTSAYGIVERGAAAISREERELVIVDRNEYVLSSGDTKRFLDHCADLDRHFYVSQEIVQPERVAKICDETAERWSAPIIISVGPCEAVAAKPRKLRISK